MKLADAMLVAACAVTTVTSTHAQSEPTARRVYLLCQMEDPSCPSLIQEAYNAFLANPTWTVCYPDSQPDPGCPGGRGRRGTSTCKFRPEPTLTLREIYVRYMYVVSTNSMLWGEPARIGMLMTMSSLNRCR